MQQRKNDPVNRLVHEKSPYLLQHANNPVDWHPWADEAFERARKENKPIFLSIGYSTCHWCHVMAHESFESEEIARLINEIFIPVKVDREERPDIDNIYMSAAMAMTGQGGWPLTVFLTADKKPFFAGTYFPPYAKWGSPGLIDILNSVANSWKNDRDQIINSSISLTDTLKEYHNKDNRSEQMTEKILERAYHELESSFDPQFGGFGNFPKFPSSHILSLLLRFAKRHNDPEALDMVEHTLVQMAKGGFYDHLGSGFHRYSTDREWQIPHFEKMLYDQAILIRTYLEAYQFTKKEVYATIAREVLDYVLNDMRSKLNGFYCALDADSEDPYQGSHEKKEGAYYLWRYDEIVKILGEKDSAVFNFFYGVKIDGNAHHDPQGEFSGLNVIFAEKTLSETAGHFTLTEKEIDQVLIRSRAKLLEVRNERAKPHLDDKILVDWNSLMISALTLAYQVLGEEKYQKAACTCVEFINKTLFNKSGRLLHRYRDGETLILGMIDDHAFFANALLDVYEITFDAQYIEKAMAIAEEMIRLFWDKEKGGFFFTGSDAEDILYRKKEIYDGAIPSGNSIAALVLVRLSKITFDPKWEDLASRLFQSFAAEIGQHPSSYSQMLIAYDFYLGPSIEIVIADKDLNMRTVEETLRVLKEFFIPNKVVLWHSKDVSGENIRKLAPFISEQKVLDDELTIYVCQNHVCQLPIHSVAELKNSLRGLSVD